MESLSIITNKSFRAIGFHKSRSPSSPYGPAPQGSQLIMLRKPALSLSCLFWLGNFPRSKIISESIKKKIESHIITILKKMERFVSKNGV